MKRIVLFLTLLVLIVPFIPPVNADGGLFHYEQFDIYEPGQNAVIAWNGQEEIMVLSVDVYSNSGNTKAVHVIPFPNRPTYNLADAELFSRIQSYMSKKRGYSSNIPDIHELLWGPPLGYNDAMDILSHERIGPHEITVVEVKNANNFMEWANNYFENNGLDDIVMPDQTTEVVNFYMLKGYNYFVFDIIDIETNRRSIDPLAYTFQTDVLYYPLKISSLISGHATIDLALITPSDMMLDYRSILNLGFECESTNLLSHQTLEYLDENIEQIFDGDIVLEHYRDEYSNLELLDDDVELPKVDTIWQKNEGNYIFKPLKGDFNGDGSNNILYFKGEGIVLLNSLTGDEIWFVDTQGYPNYNKVNFIDVNSDNINEILIHDNYNIYLIDSKTGNLILTQKINHMNFYEIKNNEWLYIFDAYTVSKLNMNNRQLEWERGVDYFNNSGFDFYSYVENTLGISHYHDYENYEEVLNCYDNYYHPFDRDTLTFCDVNNDSIEEILLTFQNTTCLINNETGELIWQTAIFNRYEYNNHIRELSVVFDLDNDTILDILVTTLDADIYLSGKNGSILENISLSEGGNEFGSGSRTLDFSDGDQYICDIDSDGIEDYIIIKKQTTSVSTEIYYSLYYSSKDQWTEEKYIEFDFESYLSEVFAKSSTLILRFGKHVFGIDINLNEIIWELNLGVPIYMFDLVNVDDDSINEIVFVTETKIVAMDIPSIPMPSVGNTTIEVGPFTYNDNETPIEAATIYFENDDGLLVTSETNKSGGSTVDIFPNRYRCHIKIEEVIIIEYFNIIVSDKGIVVYETPDGRIPISTYSAPKRDSKSEEIQFINISLITVIIIMLILIVFLLTRQKKNR